MVLIRFEPSVTHRCTSVCNSDVDSRVYSVFYMLFFITMQVQTHRKPHGKAEGRWFTEIGPESQTEKSFFFFFFKGGEVGIRGRAAEGEAHNEAVLGRQHEGQ